MAGILATLERILFQINDVLSSTSVVMSQLLRVLAQLRDLPATPASLVA